MSFYISCLEDLIIYKYTETNSPKNKLSSHLINNN